MFYLTSQVGAGSRSLEFVGASMTVFFIHSVVGGENNDSSHVLLFRVVVVTQ
jgi:hypothetical protein